MQKGLLYYPILYVRSFFFLLTKIPFILIMILIGFYAFYINDQGLDMIASFNFMTVFKDPYITSVILFFFIWAGTIWNVSRILLAAANLKKLVENQIEPSKVLPQGVTLRDDLVIASIDPNYKRIIERLIKWVPRILALMPYLIFILSYLKENYSDKSFSWLNIMVVALIGTIHFFTIVFRRDVAKKVSKKGTQNIVAAEKKAYDWEGEKHVWRAVRKSGVFSNSIITLFTTIFVFGYAVYAAFGSPTDGGKPGLIILSSLIVYTIVGLIINLYINRFRIPIFLLMVLFAVFVSSNWNDNHSVQMLTSTEDSVMLYARKPDAVYFSEWLDDKISKKKFDTTRQSNIFLVASEGGGIRNCYWTYAVLQKLQNLQPSFYDQTFAVTGASGGSMGLGFYYNYIYHNSDKLGKEIKISGTDSTNLDAICSADYLSRVTYGFLYPDLIQRFIPWPIESWDRGKYLANSFDDGFSGMSNTDKKNLLNLNYLQMWSDKNAYDHPAILFNSTWVEAGSKAIFSPFKLSPQYYADAMDILSVTKRSVPMKETMVSSARFPVLTSAAILYYPSKKNINGKPQKLGHIFDGGGFENSGIQTAQQTEAMMKAVLENKGYSNKFKIKIIYIGFGKEPMAPDLHPSDSIKYKDPLGSTYELSALVGGSNTIFRWIFAAHGLAIQLDPDMNVLDFGLRSKFDSTKHKLPLGLYMSTTSKDSITNEINGKGSPINIRNSIDTFNTYFKKGKLP